MDDVIFQSLDALINGLKAKEFSSVELTQSYIQRTKAVESKVGAFLSFDEDKTIKEAQASDKRRAEGTLLGELDGIPIGLKDIFAEKDQPLTCASRILEHFISPYDATLVQHLRKAGMVLWGRLNMDEFAMGSSSEHSAFKMTHNPWDLTRIPGGSSSGSAAAVAAGEVPVALGTDTGGSIRQPAALCGVVGIKPSYGRISRYGMVAFASSLDQAGVFARTVSDTARILSVLCGADPKDATSARKPVPNFLGDMKANKGRQWTLGVSDAYFQEGLNPEVRQYVERAIEFYKNLGYRIVPIQLKTLDYAIPVYYVIASAEASSNLARFDGIRYGYRSPKAQTIDQVFAYSRGEGLGSEVKRRTLLGLHVLSSGKYDAYYYDKAQKVRRLIYNDFMDVFKQVDAILAPTTPVPANKQGEKDTPLAMYLSDIYTVSVNLAGLPGMSIPCGFTQNGLPIGMQLIGKPFEESTLLSIAEAFEAGHDYNNRYPSL